MRPASEVLTAFTLLRYSDSTLCEEKGGPDDHLWFNHQNQNGITTRGEMAAPSPPTHDSSR